MDDPYKYSPQSTETKNILPDVVHSQQILAIGDVVTGEIEEGIGNVASRNEGAARQDDESITESISEHIPSKLDYSTDSDGENNKLKVEAEQEQASRDNSANIPFPHSPVSENPGAQDYSKVSTSWPLDANAVSDIHLSEESPVNLALSSDISKEATQDNKSQTTTPQPSAHDTPLESPRSGAYLDSLNEESSQRSEVSQKSAESDKNDESLKKDSTSGSEEIIKLDIRGKGVPRFPFPSAKIIFGPPPEGSTILEPSMKPIPVFPNLLSPFLVGANENVKIEEVYNVLSKDNSPEKSDDVSLLGSVSEQNDQTADMSLKENVIDDTDHRDKLSPKDSVSDKIVQSDLLIEELTVDEVKKEKDNLEDTSLPPKSMAPEETMSFSTMTTDYKTICEEYHAKLEHLEAAITQRDDLIEELTVSLQRSLRERDDLKYENQHLTTEVCHLQNAIGTSTPSDHDTIKAQLSDLFKYQSMIKEDSTKFYSALMSGGSSMQSSNGEKDNDREEITVHYSRSDLKSSEGSDDIQTGFENKIGTIINKFDEYIEENLRNKLRESLIQVLCDEIGRMRIEFDTDVKDLESQLTQDKQAFTVETRRLRELLASVKAGNADIEELRNELSVKHEKEMENLRTYFEKKCSDMERSYSEEVWRGVCATALGSLSSLEGADGAGDHPRRRAKSAELPPLSLESTPLDQAVKQIAKKYEQHIEDMRTEHVAYVNELQAKQRDSVATFEEQISQLKTHIQNSESNVLYPQDIDLELEKKMEAQLEQRLEEVREQVRQDVVNHLQEQLQVLLSDPDAEVSSWPLELVALRDKIHGDAKTQQEKELSSLRDELSATGEDKWKQRRNLSFDQNRHLDELTKERDELRRVAVSLHGVVGQLVAYCASAEDELNRTVLAQLLGTLLPDADHTAFEEEESRPGTPNQSAELNASAVSRAGKHVHFAPDLHDILTDLDEEGIVGFLQQQRDLSADIKRELEHSLRRLRHEAHSLLDLSQRLANKKESKMLESSVQITELVKEMESKQHCENCELHRKNMEEAMAECLQRENLLRSDLEAAMIKIAQLLTSGDVIAEGYGTGVGLHPSPGPRGPRRSSSEPGALSPEPTGPGLLHDMELLLRERDDLHQQLEAANRQLRSTRQFVEEQASERETERDEFARRLADLREENARLSTRLQSNTRILSEMRCLRLSYCNCREHDKHVEQLEAQTREMNQIITELEAKKASADDDLKATEEKIILLRDIIANLETQLEQKAAHEKEILEQLEQMRRTIEDRDSKMRSLLGELELMKSERAEQSDVVCLKCGQEEDKAAEMMENVKEQVVQLEEWIHRRTRKLERAHEVCSTSCSEPSEDVSLRDQRDPHLEAKSPEAASTPRCARMAELCGVWECVQALARAEDAAFKRIADLEMQRNQLKDVAQEVRAERDVLQTRMSEQALKISSLSARLHQQRNDAEALSHQATSQLSVQLHDALAEVQRLKEDLESKDKQLTRLKQNLEEKEKLNEQHSPLYGNSCNPKDKVIILERELSSAQSRIAQLEQLARSLERDKDELQVSLRDQRRLLAEKGDQLQELLALKLDDDKDEKSENFEGKASGRTLSDIVSISEFDEQDLQMRRAELKAHNVSGTPFVTDTRDKSHLNKTLPPDLQRANMSSLNIEYIDHFEIASFSPRADSLPAHLTSTQNKDLFKEYKRNANETTMFGTLDKIGEKILSAQKIPDNCSMYPNREVDVSKDNSVEPKKINFSIEPTIDNKSNDEEFTSLRELGITLDIKQENFPDILTQLKHEIKKSRKELETCKSELKNAEEQLCEFPALKEEVEELKSLLENTMATMENDKKFYENQLENFSSNKKLLEQRLTELSQEVNDKSKDLHLLKEDILRRENMILELAKEKRNLTNKMTELEVKIDELKSRNTNLEKCETEMHQLREKATEVQKLEQLVSEKNQQIDSLNQHLDRLDDLQRCLNDKTEEFDTLKEAFEEKSTELFQLQDTVEALNRDVAKLNEDNDNLNSNNKDLKLKLTKLEKEHENASLKLQSSEVEIERVNSLNTELTLKIEELKLLTEKLKDKETEIEILHEDINYFHEEIASLKEQLKMVSRSPSPRSKSGDERKSADRQVSGDKKQLVKIRKQISLMQHELDFNKKELNDQAFELARAKLDVTELRNSLSQATKLARDREAESAEVRGRCAGLQEQLHHAAEEKRQLAHQMEHIVARIREESNVSELKAKLDEKAERCRELEAELQDMRALVTRARESPRRSPSACPSVRALSARSPTAELERAVRDQLQYSHSLDEDIMDQILSTSSDEAREDIPRLALNTSKSSSSIHSSSSERIHRLRSDKEKLQLQVDTLEARLKDKDALITELNRVRDKLVQDWQSAKLRLETERENCARLQLLLDTHKETSLNLQNQDTNMIQILKKRLESCMQCELELQQREHQHKARIVHLERQLAGEGGDTARRDELQHELEKNCRLSGEISLLKSKLEVERSRYQDLQAALEHARAHAQRELDARMDVTTQLKGELAEMQRLKHDASVELLRAKELVHTQSTTISELERRLTGSAVKQRPSVDDALTEIESHKSELAREIASFKKCLAENSSGPELVALRNEKQLLTSRVHKLEAELQTRTGDEKDQMIRFLHGRCLRLESWRKALVWQKRYLQRVVAGYSQLERTLLAHDNTRSRTRHPRGRARFKCLVTAVLATLRMGFLVRRRLHMRSLSAACILRPREPDPDATRHMPMSEYTGTSPPSRDRPAFTPVPRVRLREAAPASPALSEFSRRPHNHSTPREEPFILSSPRPPGIHKLELVARCLRHPPDVP